MFKSAKKYRVDRANPFRSSDMLIDKLVDKLIGINKEKTPTR